MFSGCTNLKTLILGKNILTIEANAFKGTGIETVTIPDASVFIKDSAFVSCNSLKTVVIGKEVIEISKKSFSSSASHLNSVTFNGNKLWRIDDEAFRKASFTEVTIPSSVEIINDNSFADVELLFFICFHCRKSNIRFTW